jgi:hypothetical protein
MAEPSAWRRGGKPYLARALLLVTSGSVFWIVAVGPEKTAMRGLSPALLVATNVSVEIASGVGAGFETRPYARAIDDLF